MNNHTLQQMTLENIARACGGTYVGEDTLRGSEITGAVIDSRQVEPGYLYIPIRGERVDGHRFIPDVHSGSIQRAGVKGYCRSLPRHACNQNYRDYGKCWKNKYKRDDFCCFGTEI